MGRWTVGYANDARSMHRLQKELADIRLPYETTMAGVALENYNQENPGFLRVTADAEKLLFQYFSVPFDGSAVTLFDQVEA